MVCMQFSHNCYRASEVQVAPKRRDFWKPTQKAAEKEEEEAVLCYDDEGGV